MNILTTESTEHGDIPIDIYTKLANDRIIFIYDYIDDRVASDIIATLLLKDCEDEDQKITLLINSEGGDIRSCFAIYDTLQMLSCEIETVCVGSAMNEAILLLVAGTPGKRFATKNALICPSQLLQEKYHRANLSDAKNILERIQKDNKNFLTEIGKKIGKKYSDLLEKFDKKVYMNAQQAKNFGIIDDIIGSK